MNQLRFLLCVLLSGLTGLTFAQSTLQDSLVAWYAFDGNLIDSSGNGHDLTLLTGANTSFVADHSGNAAKAIRNIGSNGMKSGYFTDSTWTAASISLWYKHDGFNQLQVLLQGKEMGFGVVYRYPTASVLKVGSFFSGSSATQYQFPGDSTDTSWHHLVVTNNGDTTEAYLDGYYHGMMLESLFTSSTGANSAVYVGCSNSGYAFRGSLDEVRIYNRVLSASDVTKLYSGVSGISETPADMNRLRLAIYPNPGTGLYEYQLNAETPIKGSLSVINAIGQVVLEKKVSSPQGIFDLSSFATGVYTVRMTDGNEVIGYQKVIKQ